MSAQTSCVRVRSSLSPHGHADTGGVTAAAGRGSPWLRAPSRSYRRTLAGARRSIFLETLLGAGMNGPSETLLGAEGLGVTLSSVLRENMRSAML